MRLDRLRWCIEH